MMGYALLRDHVLAGHVMAAAIAILIFSKLCWKMPEFDDENNYDYGAETYNDPRAYRGKRSESV